MIVVDTSALMSIVLDEAEADACAAAIVAAPRLLISAGTLAEALIVADRRQVGDQMRRLVDGLGFEVVDVTAASAQRIAGVYTRWGKGVHPAGLNYGDCFAYEAAAANGCPLLYIGSDFKLTDAVSALAGA